MKKYNIIKITAKWSTDSLKKSVEESLNENTKNGYEVASVSFGLNMWWMPTAFITFYKIEQFEFEIGHTLKQHQKKQYENKDISKRKLIKKNLIYSLFLLKYYVLSPEQKM